MLWQCLRTKQCIAMKCELYCGCTRVSYPIISLVLSSLCALLISIYDTIQQQPADASILVSSIRETLGGWYMLNHGVGTMANVEDMCTLLQVSNQSVNITLNMCIHTNTCVCIL
jgi:hypothetical protein